MLVFILMLIPVRNGSSMYLMRAESPGPSVSKFVPRVRNTAILLYINVYRYDGSGDCSAAAGGDAGL